MPRVHPTAIVDPQARLADDVEVGPYAIVEPDVAIGPGTKVGPHAIIRRYTTIGANNWIDSGCSLGGVPQDLKFDPGTVSYLRIGDGNTFREGVTVSRATGEGAVTTVGNGAYLMGYCHVGHNATIEDEAILANASAVSGYAVIGRRAILSGSVLIHQFTWVGEMTMSQGNSATGCHVPPYMLWAGINQAVSLNLVGLRRAEHLGDEDRRQIKEAFSITYRTGLTPGAALQRMDACTNWGEAAGKFREFVRKVVTAKRPFNRPLISIRYRRRGGDATPD